MTKGLVERPGEFRKCAVGVMNGAGFVVHLAPRFELVPGLMDDLFAWLDESEEPMLIKSCVFHWCFEDIHPPIGVLICKEHNRVLAKFHLEKLGLPMGISDYEIKKVLPTQAHLAQCYRDAERQFAQKGKKREGC